ncbi:DUF262 domain-containing protein [Streptomyces sp. NPDC058469]|uniref:DUF262 domain-containing protein n=1 Tax=Streptomyces sp. NPDC058469 TaxID=3346514 RepID=UPI00364A0925
MAIIKHAARQTLGQLIGANNPVVTVPDDSQRQYAWTKKEVDTYWADIQKFRLARESGKESASEYFIGPIVTITDEHVKSRSLLDGQQRLTTSTILIAVIRDILWRIGSPEARSTASNIQRDYIARKAGRREPIEYFLVLSLFDRDFFRDFIQDWNELTGKVRGVEDPKKRPSHKLIQEAYSNFESKITAELSSYSDEDSRLDWLDSLYECLIKGLVFVEIQTPTSSDANEVFETINSRGKDLSTVDLVRNFLMERSREDLEKQRVNDAWRVLLDKFDKREEIERFLRHFWVARHGDVKSHSLYATIRGDLTREFDKRPHAYTAGAFAAELESASIRYVDLIHCSTGVDEFDSALSEIKALNADALHPLLLAASEKNDYAQLQDLIEACLSYYVRWTVIGRRESTLLEENIFEVAKEFSGGAGAESILRRVCGWIPDNETFKVDFEEASIPKPSQARYLLEKVEAKLRNTEGVDELEVASSTKVHVEQIYPQQPNPELRLDEHDSWVHRLGNVTLLNGRKNQTNSNRPFPEKVSIYEESALLVSSETQVFRLWDSQKSRWRPEGIIERQADLAKTALTVWPSSSQWQ